DWVMLTSAHGLRPDAAGGVARVSLRCMPPCPADSSSQPRPGHPARDRRQLHSAGAAPVPSDSGGMAGRVSLRAALCATAASGALVQLQISSGICLRQSAPGLESLLVQRESSAGSRSGSASADPADLV